MADNIIKPNFKEKRPALVRECVCGCQVFFILSTGYFECGSCKVIIEGIYVTDVHPEVYPYGEN